MSDFEAKSGQISQFTEWGSWSQTVQDVTVEVVLEKGTRGKEVQVDIETRSIECTVRGKQIFKGTFCEKVSASESIWSIEDQILLRIILMWKC